ncbi:MAG: amidohydrolase [Bacteroidetes bacterium]|nr:amidohydrolase [Bacteroidota bacterium]
MKVSIIQTHLFWEDREKNLSHFDALIDKLKEPTDLIILPEMFTTGFSMDPAKVAEEHLTVTYNWLLKKAKEKNAVIAGSVATKEDDKYYNRLHWIEPNGNSSFYDKRHLFRMAKEDEKYTAGKEKIIKQINDWKIMPLVCYDLRFPVWSRNFKEQQPQYDVLIYVANWPEVRNYPWKQLLIARAIENQCYVIGLNRVGKDGNDYNHSGDSVIINPRGEIINQPKANEENIETIILDRNYLEAFRKLFPVGLDADDFELK